MRTFYKDSGIPLSLRRSLVLVTIGGSLYNVYAAGTSSAVATDFYRAIGANDLHFGIMGGIPTAMLLLYFAGAFFTNHLRRRKTFWIVTCVAARLLYIPIAFIPLLFPAADPAVVIPVILVLMAMNVGMLSMVSPLWVSWMADLIPHRVLNSYWGVRQRWMCIVILLSSGGVAGFAHVAGNLHWPMTRIFPATAAFGVLVGVIDILLFAGVDEPQQAVTRGRPALDMLLEPLKNVQARSFILFSCAWCVSIYVASPFMVVYALKILHVTAAQATMMWSLDAVGTGLTAERWGRIADRHGHKPVMAVCIALKPMVLVAMLFLTPGTVLWVLPPLLFVDGIVNAGMSIAMNGYMFKTSPRKNKSMFVASMTGLPGICGGLTAVAAGWVLSLMDGLSFNVAGMHWTNYHLIFIASIVLRGGCIPLVRWVNEPGSSTAAQVMKDFFAGRPALLPSGLSADARIGAGQDG